MNYQEEIPQEVIDLLKNTGIEYFSIDYYAFPEVFSSTSGPHGGIGGCAMSTFTVEAYVVDGVGPTVYICDGKYRLKRGPYKAKWQ